MESSQRPENNRLLEDFFFDREERYLDYARYECKQAGIEQDYEDLYMEVMIGFFEKKREQAEALINKLVDPKTVRNKKLSGFFEQNGNKFPLCEFDFFFLRTVKLNAISPRAPFRWNYHRQPDVDANADYSRIDVKETEYDNQPDKQMDVHLERFDDIRSVADDILTEDELKAFTHTFLCGEAAVTLKELPVKETRKYARSAEIKIKGYFETMKTTHYDSQKAKSLKKPYEKIRDGVNKLNRTLAEGNNLALDVSDLRKIKAGDFSSLESMISTYSSLGERVSSFMQKLKSSEALSDVELNFLKVENNQLSLMNELRSYIRNQCTIKPETKGDCKMNSVQHY